MSRHIKSYYLGRTFLYELNVNGCLRIIKLTKECQEQTKKVSKLCFRIKDEPLFLIQLSYSNSVINILVKVSKYILTIDTILKEY